MKVLNAPTHFDPSRTTRQENELVGLLIFLLLLQLVFSVFFLKTFLVGQPLLVFPSILLLTGQPVAGPERVRLGFPTRFPNPILPPLFWAGQGRNSTMFATYKVLNINCSYCKKMLTNIINIVVVVAIILKTFML